MSYLLYALAGYLSGSVLYSYEIPKVFCGIDICAQAKDHNPGAANVFRYAGPLPGAVCVALDLLKGFLPVAIAVQRLTPHSPWFGLVLAAPVLGHAYPLYYGLRGGGKAIAVSFGALLGLLPDLTPALILAIYYLFFSLVAVIDPHFYRSVITFTLFGATIALWLATPPYTIGCVLISVVVIRRHFARYEGEKPSVHLGPHHAKQQERENHR